MTIATKARCYRHECPNESTMLDEGSGSTYCAKHADARCVTLIRDVNALPNLDYQLEMAFSAAKRENDNGGHDSYPALVDWTGLRNAVRVALFRATQKNATPKLTEQQAREIAFEAATNQIGPDEAFVGTFAVDLYQQAFLAGFRCAR